MKSMLIKVITTNMLIIMILLSGCRKINVNVLDEYIGKCSTSDFSVSSTQVVDTNSGTATMCEATGQIEIETYGDSYCIPVTVDFSDDLGDVSVSYPNSISINTVYGVVASNGDFYDIIIKYYFDIGEDRITGLSISKIVQNKNGS